MSAIPFDPGTDPFAAARGLLATFVADLSAHGVAVGTPPLIEHGDGMLCAYHLVDGKIYLAFPDLSDPIGRVKALFLRVLMSCDSNDELAEMIALFLPRLLAHELTHCVRHRLGLFGVDLWLEEQIANTVANALTAHRYAPDRRSRLAFYLRRAADGLAERLDCKSRAVDTYHDSLAAFVVTGVLGNDVAASLESIATLFKTDVGAMLKDSGLAIARDGERLIHRAELVGEFNDDYTKNISLYMHYQVTWNLVDIESSHRYYLDEVAVKYLGRARWVLERDNTRRENSIDDVRALYAAAAQTHDLAARRFLYKRYRERLIGCISDDAEQIGASGGQSEWATHVRSRLEGWADGQPEPLRFLSASLSPRLRALLPQHLEHTVSDTEPASGLASADDRRLWASLTDDAPSDPAATETWRLLRALDRIDIFKTLSSHLLLELAGHAIDAHFDPGEVVIWQGENSRDVFLIISGALDVITAYGSSEERCRANLSAGDVFGEMAFLSGEPRSAMVKAHTEARCLVIKGADLNAIAYVNAELPIAIGRLLARRLSAVNARDVHLDS